MLHFFYSLFFRIALPFVLLRLWWIGRTNPEAFVRWQERLGYVEAFLIQLSFALFYLVYTIVFTWVYDRVFPDPSARAAA